MDSLSSAAAICIRACTGHPQKPITRSLLCISTTGSNDLERSDTKLEAPSFPIEYKIFCSTFFAIPYINRFRNDFICNLKQTA